MGAKSPVCLAFSTALIAFWRASITATSLTRRSARAELPTLRSARPRFSISASLSERAQIDLRVVAGVMMSLLIFYCLFCFIVWSSSVIPEALADKLGRPRSALPATACAHWSA